MSKLKISEDYIIDFWCSLYEYYVPQELCGLNLNNTSSIDKLIAEYLVPEVESGTVSWKFRFKESFRYAINFWDDAKLKELFYEPSYGQFHLPRHMSVREFYIHIWRALYLGEPYEIEDKSKYTIVAKRNSNRTMCWYGIQRA